MKTIIIGAKPPTSEFSIISKGNFKIASCGGICFIKCGPYEYTGGICNQHHQPHGNGTIIYVPPVGENYIFSLVHQTCDTKLLDPWKRVIHGDITARFNDAKDKYILCIDSGIIRYKKGILINQYGVIFEDQKILDIVADIKKIFIKVAGEFISLRFPTF